MFRTYVWGDIMYNKTSKRKYVVIDKFRFFVFLFSLIVLSMYIILIFSSNTKAYSSIYDEKYIEVEVKYGDTLWDIAKKHMPDDYDIRKMVYELREFNNMKDVNIYPGDVIKIPNR